MPYLHILSIFMMIACGHSSIAYKSAILFSTNQTAISSLLKRARSYCNHFTHLLFSETGNLARASLKSPMAIRSSCHRPAPIAVPSFGTPIAVPSFGTRKATLRFSTAVHSSHEHLSNSARSIKAVFEDQVRGVVCYRDDRGEVICEGYDEGSRLGMRLPEKACFPWPMGIRVNDFIELSTFRVLEDEDALK